MQGDKLLEKLTTSVEKLQSSCNYELEQQDKADNLEYTNMASLYFWWLEASSIDGFLDAEYAKLSTRKLRAVSYGVNFRGILLKFYGNMLGDTVIDRKSRVLNELDKEANKNPALYAKDGVKKLVQFIENSGGMAGLYERTYGNAKREVEAYEYDDDEEIEADVAAAGDSKKQYMEVVRVAISNDMRIKFLVDDAKEFFKHNKKLQTVQISPLLNARSDDFVVVAARKVNDSYEIIELSKTEKQLDTALVAAYRQQYAALPNSTRCVFETIKTQCLTQKAARHMDKALLEPPSYHDGDTVYRKLPAKRRLIYSYERNELILSPVDYEDENGNIVGGAVTIAKPKTKIFENAASDLYMPMMDRRVVEQRLIAPNDINLFKASSADHMCKHPKFDGDLSHLLRLDSKLNNGDFIFLNFFGFGDDAKKLLPQLDYNEANDASSINVPLSGEQVRKIATVFAKAWMQKIGDNINRQQHRFWELSISKNKIQIDFDEIEGFFTRGEAIAFDIPLNVELHYMGTFFTQELVPALLTLGELDIVGDVVLQLSDAGIVLQYATDAANYKVCIPTWNYGTENRHHQDFTCLYEPFSCYENTEKFEFDEYELEDDFYKGLELLNMTDKAESQDHYKKQMQHEQTELADGFPELSEHISWLTYEVNA
jgi:hypothetical protein